MEGRTGNERELSASINAAWASDGSNITLSVPSGQTQTVSYTRGNLTLKGEFEDVEEDAYLFSEMTGYANYPASLEIRISKFLSRFDDQIPGEVRQVFEREGLYYISQTMTFVDSGGAEIPEMVSYRGSPFSAVKTLASIKDIAAPVVPSNGFNIAARAPYSIEVIDEEPPAESDPSGEPEGDHDGGEHGFCAAAGSAEALGYLGMSIIAPNEPQCAEGQVEVLELYPLLYGKTLEFDFGPNLSLDGQNLNRAVDGQSNDDIVPVVQFALDQVANGSGTFKLKVSLIDGSDDVRDPGERELTAEVNVAWTGNGEVATMSTVGPLEASFIGSGPTVCPADATGEPTCIASISNVGPDTLKFNAEGPGYSPSFSLKLIDLFDANVAGATWSSAATVSFEDYFTTGSGEFNVMVELIEDGSESFYYGGMPVNAVEGILKVDLGSAPAP